VVVGGYPDPPAEKRRRPTAPVGLASPLRPSRTATVAGTDVPAPARCAYREPMRNRQVRPAATANHPERQAGGRRRGRPRPHKEQPGAGATRLFAAAVPGLAPLVRRELAELPGTTVTDTGFDGRSDLVLFDADRGARDAVLTLRTTEDVFVEVGRTLRSEGDHPRLIAQRIWRPQRVQRALSVWAGHVRPLSAAMTFRVVTRVVQERSFLRTELRRELARIVGDDKPRWRLADPAAIEVWVSEYQQGRIVAGLRLTSVRMRQHGGRGAERRGALRPTVAAAMVMLAGNPSGVLLDPCCGSGTILAEATKAGWKAEGLDIDPAAAEVARRNVPNAVIQTGDARHLGLPDGSVGACVSNLPFGRQHGVQGSMREWVGAVLGGMARVTRPGGRIVLLAPRIPREAAPREVRLCERFRLRLLGTPAAVWVYEKA
jgi:23S rRNA G2445 N2-methylase RlmL